MKKKLGIFAGAAVVIILLIVSTVTGEQPVEVVQTERDAIRAWVEDTAYVQAKDEVVIDASQSGRIIRIAVEVGQKVTAGQELLLMENLDMQYQLDALAVQIEQLQGQLGSGQIALEQYRLDLEEEQKKLQRGKELFQAGAIAKAEYEAGIQKYLSLQKTLQKQEVLLQSLDRQIVQQRALYNDMEKRNRQLIVKSPQTGTILDLPVKKEQSVTVGDELVQLGTEGALELIAELLSDDLAAVKIGQKAEITAPVLGDQVLHGKVSKIYPRAYEKTSALGVIQRRVPVLISLPENEGLKPGYEVQVKIEIRNKNNVLVLPRTAVRVNAQGQDEVLLVNEGRIRHVAVQTGLKNQERVEISSGLKAGQTVVRDASTDIKENTRVKIH